MKRALIALLLCTFYIACKNESIIVDKNYVMNLNIASSAPIEEFGVDVVERFKTRYLAENKSLLVASYIYNKQGLAVDSLKTISKTFGNINFPAKIIPEGKYTIVTIEMLVNSEGELSPYWNIINSMDISTLAIAKKERPNTYIVEEDGMIGLSSNDIDVKGDTDITIPPHALGALMDIRYFNFDYSKYNSISFVTEDAADGYLVNPTNSNKHYFKSSDENTQWEVRGISDRYPRYNEESLLPSSVSGGNSVQNERKDSVRYYTTEANRLKMGATSTIGGDWIGYTTDDCKFIYLFDVGDQNWSFVCSSNQSGLLGKLSTKEVVVSPKGKETFCLSTFKNGEHYYSAIAYIKKRNMDNMSATICTRKEEIDNWYDSLNNIKWLSKISIDDLELSFLIKTEE